MRADRLASLAGLAASMDRAASRGHLWLPPHARAELVRHVNSCPTPVVEATRTVLELSETFYTAEAGASEEGASRRSLDTLHLALGIGDVSAFTALARRSGVNPLLSGVRVRHSRSYLALCMKGWDGAWEWIHAA